MNIRPGSTSPYVRIVEAVSKTGCAAAVVIPADGDEPRKVRCSFFTATIVDAEPYDSAKEDLIPTGEDVQVSHKFKSPMTAGADITIALRSDGQWTLIVWECS